MAQSPPCPYCGASSFRFRDQHWLVCTACEREFNLERDLCRQCGWISRAEAQFCEHCDTPLRRDLVDRLISVRSKDRRAWRKLYGEMAMQGKQEDIQASENRMQTYLAEDRARREAQAQARAAQRIRERRALIVISVIAAVLIALLLALSLLGPIRELARPASAIPGGAPLGEWAVLGAIYGMYQTVLA